MPVPGEQAVKPGKQSGTGAGARWATVLTTDTGVLRDKIVAYLSGATNPMTMIDQRTTETMLICCTRVGRIFVATK